MTEELTERRQGRPVGEDLRRRAVAAVLEGDMSARAAARHFRVSHTAVSRWVARYRRRGNVRPDKSPGRRSRTEPERERIFRLLDGRPDLSLRALQQALAAEGAAFSASALHRFLTRRGLRRRRRLSWRRNPAPQAAGGR